MAIQFIGYQTGGAGTVTIPTHQVGDLIIIACTGSSTTALPAGWIKIESSGNGIMGYRFAKTASETSGTWTNGDAMIAVVYRGVGAIGATAGASSAASGSCTYPSLTCNGSQSWILIGLGGNGLSTPTANPPTGFTERGYDNNGSDRSIIIWDSAAVDTAYTTENGETVTNYRSWSVELFPATNGPALMSAVSSGNSGTTFGAGVSLNMPASIAAGDLLLAFSINDNPGSTNMAISGWTQVYQEAYTGTNAIKAACFAKIAVGSDTATMTGAAQDYCAVVVKITNHNVKNIATDIKVGTKSEAATTTPDTNSLDAGAVGAWLFIVHEAHDHAGTETTAYNNVVTTIIGSTQTSGSTTTNSAQTIGEATRGLQTFPAIADFTSLSASQESLTQVVGIPAAADPSAGMLLFRSIP